MANRNAPLENSLEGRLLFAVPKKGRLNQAALNLLQGADIQFRRETRLDIALVKNLPIALIFLPAADIPTFVGEGQVDLGITGWDQVQEHDAGVRALFRARRFSGEITPEEENVQSSKGSGCETVMDLGFGGCKLQVQVPQNGAYSSPKDLIGKNIGTSFVNLAHRYFANLEMEVDSTNPQADSQPVKLSTKLRTNIIELSGSVEAACALGVADGIVDLVESGETMKAAGLIPIDTVIETSAILIKSRKPTNPELVDLIASRIRGVITAQRYVLCQYNVQRSGLAAAAKIAPGKRAPTITSLEEDGWVAVSVMVEKKKIAPIMDELQKVGAHDILVLDIANTRD
ncbi:ATP phosphoribosyltransferase [Xylariaceae sp. FL1272]|nr:ATP phosphoribosyltransferase [Xylariaceae sp. FL1272]